MSQSIRKEADVRTFMQAIRTAPITTRDKAMYWAPVAMTSVVALLPSVTR